jgi:hypothetical protein
MSKTILDAFENAFQNIIVEDVVSELHAVKTPMPRKIFNLMGHFEKNGEFELYEFLDRCVFYKVPKDTAPPPPFWYETAAVSVQKERIEFFYDEDFIESLDYKELAFLVAHEASHVFRLHQDIAEMEKLDPETFNIAADMVINHDILKTPKLGQYDPAPLTGKDPKTGEKKRVGVYLDQTKFQEEIVEKEGKKALHGRRVYDYLNKQKQKQPKQNAEDYYKEGSIVRVKSTGEYREITGKTKEGKITTKPVNIDEIIEKAKQSIG